MHIISKRPLREFWENEPQSENSLNEWHKRLSKLEAANIAQLRQTFPEADLVGDCIVFNVGGNKYRVITKVDFRRQNVYVRFVLTHREYDKNKWKSDC
ncbi:MAG: type II toxin-antitoxin system HigB family toxin [Pyrinomonadaceae bacterium]